MSTKKSTNEFAPTLTITSILTSLTSEHRTGLTVFPHALTGVETIGWVTDRDLRVSAIRMREGVIVKTTKNGNTIERRVLSV